MGNPKGSGWMHPVRCIDHGNRGGPVWVTVGIEGVIRGDQRHIGVSPRRRRRPHRRRPCHRRLLMFGHIWCFMIQPSKSSFLADFFGFTKTSKF